MVGIVGVTRSQDAELVGVLGGEREELAYGQAARAMVAVGIGHGHETAGGPLGAEIGSFGALSVVFCQGGFGIEKVGTEGAAVHEKVDDAFHLRWKVGSAWKIARRFEGCGEPETAEASSEFPEGAAAVDEIGIEKRVHVLVEVEEFIAREEHLNVALPRFAAGEKFETERFFSRCGSPLEKSRIGECDAFPVVAAGAGELSAK